MRIVRHWQELKDQLGALPLDTYLGLLTTLTETQLNGLSDYSPDLRDLNLYEVPRARHSLRLYSTLSPAQRQQLWQGGVLSVAQMTIIQRRLFLNSLQETNRNQTPPLNLQQWAAGSFSLSTERYVRIVEKSGGSIRTRTERVDPPPGAPGAAPAGAPGAGVVQRVAGATQSTAAPVAPPGSSAVPPRTGASAGAPDSVSRFPVTRLELRLQYGPELQDKVSLTVAERP
jgi:hypothetical protein